MGRQDTNIAALTPWPNTNMIYQGNRYMQGMMIRI